MNIDSIEKFVRVMGLTTSPHDGEVLNAIRIANGILAEADLTWEQVMTQKQIVIQEVVQKNVIEKPKNPETENKLKLCIENVRSNSGLEFLRSLNRQYQERGHLSKRQLEALDRWYENL